MLQRPQMPLMAFQLTAQTAARPYIISFFPHRCLNFPHKTPCCALYDIWIIRFESAVFSLLFIRPKLSISFAEAWLPHSCCYKIKQMHTFKFQVTDNSLTATRILYFYNMSMILKILNSYEYFISALVHDQSFIHHDLINHKHHTGLEWMQLSPTVSMA